MSAKARAKADMKVARHILAQAGVTTSQSVTMREDTLDGRNHWIIQNQTRLEVWPNSEPLKGRWSVELRLVYDTEAAGEEVFVYQGSLGLKREMTADKGPQSFIRYDVDVTRPLTIDEPCHLHVAQIGPFNDRIHIRLPGVRIPHWELKPTLQYLCSSEMRDELRARYV